MVADPAIVPGQRRRRKQLRFHTRAAPSVV